MIRINDEGDLANWFRKNYSQLGFEKIVKDNKDKFPDFVMFENGKEVRVELEVFSSNFIDHNHDENEVDRVVCAFNDIKLKIPTQIIKNVKIVKFNHHRPYSYKEEILKAIQKERIVTSREVSKLLNINWGTADRYLMELLIDGKVERIKKEGVNLWLIK